jgi:glycerol-3-phosphate dehydrogenase (NAD(P)+)
VSKKSAKCVVLGAGAWGTAVALHLVARGHETFLVPRDSAQWEQMRATGTNDDFLPGFPLPGALNLDCSFDVIRGADLVFLACASVGIVEFCSRMGAVALAPGEAPLLITLCKGFVPDSGRLPLEEVKLRLPAYATGVLSGPTHAADVARGKPTALVLASAGDGEQLLRAQGLLHAPHFRVYRSTDPVGVELGGCLKNPYAIGMGMAHGVGCADNGQAALMTRMLEEMARIGVAMGGKRETFYGLSGLGDLLATAGGKWSRNRAFGEHIVRRETPPGPTIPNQTVEGYHSAKIFWERCHRLKLVCPILDAICDVLFRDIPALEAMQTLLSRSPPGEFSENYAS